jgi:hypothetical protein
MKGNWSFDNSIVNRARGRCRHILISGDTRQEVIDRGKLIKPEGMKPDGPILISDVTGEFYQHWKRAEGAKNEPRNSDGKSA